VELTTVRGCLFAIVRNLFLRHLRHERRRAPLDERFADGRPDPEVRASDQSTLQTVLSALDALPEADRSALLMRANGRIGVSFRGRLGPGGQVGRGGPPDGGLAGGETP
jgi:RNA polymerase sigma-70 factor (ECF subfamily)